MLKYADTCAPAETTPVIITAASPTTKTIHRQIKWKEWGEIEVRVEDRIELKQSENAKACKWMS